MINNSPDIAKKVARAEKIRWYLENSDALAALLLGLTAVMLGLFTSVQMDVLDNCILGTLTVLAFALLRDRRSRDSAEREAKRSSDQVLRALAPLQASVEGLTTVKTMQGSTALEPVFASAREHTERWTFKGGTGTYTRAKTLPDCVANARHASPRRNLDIRLIILDPTNVQLCAMYASYRATFASLDPTEERWTTDRTQKESYATVLAAAWHKRSYDLLTVGVFLTSIMSTFRYDMSDSCLIVTQDDPAFPAMVIERNSPHYYAHATEMAKSQQQARHVIVNGPHAQLSEILDTEQVRQFFRAVELPLPTAYSDDDVQEIINKAIHPVNPFPDNEAGNRGRA
jgi:hypothetical protein